MTKKEHSENNTEPTKNKKLRLRMQDGQICMVMKTHYQMFKKIWLPELMSDQSNERIKAR